MDPLSHVLLGTSLGCVAFGRKLGRTAAVCAGLAAFAPDADVFIRSATDPLLAIEHHRGFTHSLFFAPIGALVVASLWMWRRRWRAQATPLYLCSLLAYISHCLLDAATSYGTQLLWPFSNHRAGWDLISIIDPLFTGALVCGLLLGRLLRNPRWVAAALVCCGIYLALGALQKARSSAVQRQLAERRGHPIARSEVMPTLANNLVWRTLYESGGQIHSDRIRVGWFSGATIAEGWSLPLVTANDLTAAERARSRRRSFERFHWFSEGWVARKPQDATVLGDMRYSLTSDAFDPIWGIRFCAADSPRDVEWVSRSHDRRIRVGDLWREVIGRDPRYDPIEPRVSGSPAARPPARTSSAHFESQVST